MEHRGRHWRLFYWVMAVAVFPIYCQAQGPVLTSVSDTVYRADGSVANGMMLISWPAFTTGDGHGVAAGTDTVTLASNGTFAVQLAPNAGATPAGVTYTVVYQLTDGTVKTEYWLVGTSSPETIAQVRTAMGTAGIGNGQFATQAYVNTQLQGVVHLSGAETITGAKSFAVSPTLPSPTQSGQAVNKGYVDSSVANSGAGNFVLKSGDTMTGALTLPGDPTASSQASTKHYVDVNTALKADLVGGTVPVGELGTGTANNGVCLHGDSTWGGCGTGTGITAGMQAIKYASDFAWTQSNSASLTAPGAATVTLTACPPGVTGTEPQYYVYISTTGTAEAVLVTGGTCAGNSQAGTLQFTTANSHPAGYSIGSASGGLQEALIAARFTPSNPTGTSQSGKVVVPPGELNAFARVSIRASNVTVDFSGSIVNCWMNDTCIFAGDPTSSTLFEDITLLNPRGRPTIAGGTQAFIEVNAQKTRVFNVATRVGLSGGTFGSYVQVDDDQAFLLDGLDTGLGGGLRCDSTVCAPAVYAPGPFNTNSAVGWLKNLNIALQCGGNGVDWESGNTLRISDSVIQGFAQYGVRTGTRRGGFGATDLENIYEEVGNCQNPSGNIGEAGVIVQGNSIKIDGGAAPQGSAPQFANTGSTVYHYYLVPHHATFGPGNPLYAGSALTNGSGSISISTPDVPGASTFDLLRVGVNGLQQAPYGTGAFGVAINVPRSSACSNGVCTFTDSQAALQSYTVSNPTYFPLITYWPGSLILTANSDSNSPLSGARAWMQNIATDIVSVSGTAQPSAISTSCDAVPNWTPTWLSCFSAMAPGTFFQQGAMLLAVKPNQDAGGTLNLKGRLNFSSLGTAPGHIVTLSDSNFQKTIATQNNRPNNDPNDAFIGYDQGDGNPAHIGISFGAPVSVTNYIGNVGDGTNWLERLTASLKEFKTNVKMDSGLTVSGSVQASSFVSTGTGAWSLQGSFGTLSAAPSGQSLIGFGTNGQLQVSANGAAVQTVALLDSNGNVETADALAATPTQCTGSFATGIQANGNANCSTADQIQLSETSAPTGVPNYGIFWFDSTCHCPKVIDNNGQAVQLGLTNVFNQDSGGTNPANTLEEVNGTNPQTLRVYRAWNNSTDWERTGFAWDQTDGYFVVKNENSGADYTTQHGLGFWIGSNIRWAIDTSSVLKPFTDNSYNIGSTSLRPKTIYAATSFDLSVSGAQTFEICNDSTTGTALNFLAKFNSASSSCAVKSASTDTGGALGIVVGGSGTTGNAVIAYRGYASCSFDGATTGGDYVQISSTNAADCHDSGAAYPGTGQVLGHVLSTNAAAGTYTVWLGPEAQGSGGAGAITSVFGRTGAVTAASGDYSVSQVTGAAPLSSPGLTGTPTAPTPASSDNSTKIATTAYVQAQTCPIWFTTPNAASTVSFSTTANKASLWGVILYCNLSTSQITYDVTTADNTSNTYDIGIVNSSGSIVAHVGSTAGTTFAPATGWRTLSWTASAQLPPGKYYVAVTTSCSSSCAVIEGGNSGAGLTYAGNISESVTTGGTLPSSITVPGDSYTATTIPSFSIH